MENDIHDYLPTNRRLAADLVGHRLVSAVRLLHEPSEEEEARTDWGPALITSDDGRRWLVEAEESKANVLITDPGSPQQENASWFAWFGVRPPVVTTDPLRALLLEPIKAVEVMSRAPEPGVPDSFAMCGLRLTTAGGHQVCVGTHLTELKIPGVWFLRPDEIDPTVRYDPLTEGPTPKRAGSCEV